MKAMKAKKAMKSMKKRAKKASKPKAMRKRKAKRVSKVGKKYVVFRGGKEKTAGGLSKSDLTKSKRGQIVSKKRSSRGKSLYNKYLKTWIAATMKARKQLNVKGFCPVGGKGAQGQRLLQLTRSIYAKSK